jgi:RHS repeat-associated protein
LLLTFFSGLASGQDTLDLNPSSNLPKSSAGINISQFERINLFSGHTSFVYPLLSVSGRGGAGYTMMLPVENQLTLDSQGVIWANILPSEITNPRYSPGSLTVVRFNGVGNQCFFAPPHQNDFTVKQDLTTVLNFAMPNGGTVVLRDQLHDGELLRPGSCNNNPRPLRGKIFNAKDGSGITFVSDSDIFDDVQYLPLQGPTGNLFFSDGTVYRIDNGRVMSIRDRQGNTLTFTYGSYSVHDPSLPPILNFNIDAWRLTGIQDSLNGPVTIAYDVQTDGFGLCDEITYQDFGSSPAQPVTQTIRVSKTNLANVFRDSQAVPQTYQQLFPGIPSGGGSSYLSGTLNPKVISAIWLPNGHSFQFRYDVYAQLARIVSPGGGAIEYDWAAGMTGLPVQDSASWFDSYRRVVERRTYPDGTNLESKTRYSRPEQATLRTFSPPVPSFYAYSSTLGYVDVDAIDPATDHTLARERHHYYGHAANGGLNLKFAPYKQGKELQVELFDGADLNTPRRQVSYQWRQRVPVAWWQTTQFITVDDQPENDPRMVETVTTLMDPNLTSSLVSKQTAIIPSDQSGQSVAFDEYNNQTDSWQYDFGAGSPGALRRHTNSEFKTDPNNSSDVTYFKLPADGGAHILRLPYKERVFGVDPGTGAESLLSYTEFAYDEAAYLVDPYGTVPAWTSPGTTARGNLTTLKRWLNFDGTNFVTFQNGPYITTHAKYDQVGNVVSKIDGKGRETQIAFSSTYNYAYPTSKTSPDPDGGGPLTALTTSTQYDLATGLATSTIDANGVRTIFDYSDPFRRLKRVTRAADDSSLKNQASYDYDDDARSATLTSDLNAFSDNLLKTVTLYDGFGRPTENRAYETSNTYIVTKQEYDILGRVKRTYNPYRTTNDETYGWTEPTYDALGRMKRLESFDHNGTSTGFATTEYAGNRVLVTDPSLRKRISETNALGQLTDVWEITSGTGTVSVSFGNQSFTGYLTHYEYDGLNNLIKVTQGQQQRTFSYDSLARLISATSPEVGPAGNGAIGYRYDENGNLSQKIDPRLLPNSNHLVVSYDYDALNRLKTRTYNDGVTANVTYTYDNAGTNSKGRLTSVSTSQSSYTYGSYDALGRPGSATQTTNGVDYIMGFSFDLAGHITSQTYPSGRKVVTEMDDGGRIAGVKNGDNGPYYVGASPSDSVNRIKYSAQGVTTALRLGNGLWEHASFNSRLEVTQFGLGTSTSNSAISQLDYFYHANGNLQTQAITSPSLSLTQNYEYDDLNRLKSAQEDSASSQTWKQTFSYDRYGNRNFGAGTTTPNPLVDPVIDPATNRIDSTASGQNLVQYDNAGNLTGALNGDSYAYDGEGRLSAVNGGNPATGGATYVYNANGQRVEKITSSGTTVFVYNIVGQLIAEYGDVPSSDSGTSYLTSDPLGSPRVITDSSGNVKARHDYLPYGEEVSGVGNRNGQNGYSADTVRQKFTSYEHDSETSLEFAQARHYSSAMGRFTRPDPSLSSGNVGNPQSWNRYSYCFGNPLNLTDPSGLDPDYYWMTNGHGQYWGMTQADWDAYMAKPENLLHGEWVPVAPGTIIPAESNQGFWGETTKEFREEFSRFLGYSVKITATGHFEYASDMAYDGVIQEIGRQVDPIPRAVAYSAAGTALIGAGGGFALAYTGAMAGGVTTLSLEAPAATEAATSTFDFAVGLGEHVQEFADETGSYTYTELNSGDANFAPENFESFANHAENIRFNTQGMNWARWGRWVTTNPESWSPFEQNVTNWELHQLLTNPEWLAKTIFH